MYDIKWIRDNPEKFDAGLKKRFLEPLSGEILQLDEAHRAAIGHVQAMQERRNAASKEIGRARAEGDETRAQSLMAEVSGIKTAMPEAEEAVRELSAKIHDYLSALPNRPLEDVPVGEDEAANMLFSSFGEVPQFAFRPKEHFDLGEALGMMDFELAAKLSGARFVALRGGLARLERALGQFMIDTHVREHGYTEMILPLLVREETAYGTGNLPKFADDLFQTSDGLWLIPTSEMTLTNTAREQILSAGDLPMRLTSLTQCFRREAGSAGRDTRGMLRQHQFSKVELVSLCAPDEGEEELARMLKCAESILQKLELPYRVMLLSSGDMGFSAAKTFDIEVWLPGQDNYREISSCSLCTDFQARRMNARFRAEDGASPEHIHTLNGSGIAIGRALIAVMENYQQEDGSIIIPEILRNYMGGLERITPA